MKTFKQNMFWYCFCVFFTGMNLSTFLHYLSSGSRGEGAIALGLVVFTAYLAIEHYRSLRVAMVLSSSGDRSVKPFSVVQFSLSLLMCGYLADAFMLRADGVSEGTALFPAVLLVAACFNCRYLYVRMLRPLKVN